MFIESGASDALKNDFHSVIIRKLVRFLWKPLKPFCIEAPEFRTLSSFYPFTVSSCLTLNKLQKKKQEQSVTQLPLTLLEITDSQGFVFSRLTSSLKIVQHSGLNISNPRDRQTDGKENRKAPQCCWPGRVIYSVGIEISCSCSVRIERSCRMSMSIYEHVVLSNPDGDVFLLTYHRVPKDVCVRFSSPSHPGKVPGI